MRVTTIVIKDIILTVLSYVYFLLVWVTVCAASFSPWCAKAALRRGSSEPGSGESPSKTSQTPRPQPPAQYFWFSRERIMPGRVKRFDSVRPRLCVQDVRRSPLERAACTAGLRILHIRRRSDRTSEALRRFATLLPALDPPRSAGGCGRGVCGVFDGGAFAMIARGRPPWSTRGTCEAKE
jgi:hypothetical protein